MDSVPLPEQRLRVEEFRRKHRIALLTMLFTDIVGSTNLKQALGDRAAIALIQRHHALIRETLGLFAEAEEIDTAGDSFFCVFAKPSDAAHFALIVQRGVRDLARETGYPVLDRIGIHVGEVFIEQRGENVRDLFGIQIDTTARIMSLGGADQILLSRFAFDNARQVLRGYDLDGVGELSWLNHGFYDMKGVEEPVEVCEVGEVGAATLLAPGDSEKAHRFHSPDAEPVLGWRPSAGQRVPNTQWTLVRALGEGGFGEVWLARHETLKQQRVIKFCFRADRARSLKREVTLFRILRERVGEQRGIVTVHDVFFDEPPFYIVMDYVDGSNLAEWATTHAPLAEVPLATRLEIVAQVADALQVAHDAGVIHRDVKPSNILIAESQGEPRVKLTDFGIGQVLSPEALAGMTKLGFTQTLMSSSNGTGTQLYMAPELITGLPATTRSDLYSLGVVLYQLIVGDLTRPVTGDWSEDIEDPLLREDLRKCLAGDAAKRFAGAADLSTQLRSLDKRLAAREAEAQRIAAMEKRAYRRGLARAIGAAAAIVTLVGALALFGWGEARKARQHRDQAQASATAEKKAKMFAETSLRRMRFGHAEQLLASDQAERAVAELAMLARDYPDSQAAGQRLLSVLVTRNFPLRSVPTLLHGSDHCYWGQFDPTGTHIVTAWQDNHARIWNATSGQLLRELPHAAPVHWVSYTPDGRFVLSAADDGTVKFWRADTGEKTGVVLQHSGPIKEARLSKDGRLLITASGKEARLWEVPSGKPIGPPVAHESDVTSVAVSNDGDCAASGSSNGVLRIWAPGSDAAPSSTTAHRAGVAHLEFNRDRTTLLTTSFDSTAKLWNVDAARQIGRSMKHLSFVVHGCFSPDGLLVATASADKTARVWDAATGEPRTESLRHVEKLTYVAFSPEGIRLVTANVDGTVRLWDPFTGLPLSERIPRAGGGDAIMVNFSPNGRHLLTTSNYGTCGLVDTGSRRSLPARVTHDTAVLDARLDPSGMHFLVATKKSVRLWDGKALRPISAPLRQEASVCDADLSPDSRLAAIGSEDGSLNIWSIESGKPSRAIITAGPAVVGVRFNRDGKYLLAATANATARVWNVESGTPASPELPLPDDPRKYFEAVVGKEGKWAAVRVGDYPWRSTCVFAEDSWKELVRSKTLDDPIDLESESGQIIIASHSRTQGLALEIGSWKWLDPLTNVRGRAMSRSGRYAIDSSGQNVLSLWQFPESALVRGGILASGRAQKLAFSGSGEYCAVYTGSPTVSLLGCHDGEFVADFNHPKAVRRIESAREGDLFLAVCADWSTTLWQPPPTVPPNSKELQSIACAMSGKLVGTDGTEHRIVLDPEAMKNWTPPDGNPNAKEDAAWVMISELKRIENVTPFAETVAWLVADPLQRSIAPGFAISTKEYLERRVVENNADSLSEVLEFTPDDARVMAKLAARWIREGDSDDPHHIARGRWLLNHALSRAPNDPEIKKLQRDYAGDTSQKADLNNR